MIGERERESVFARTWRPRKERHHHHHPNHYIEKVSLLFSYFQMIPPTDTDEENNADVESRPPMMNDDDDSASLASSTTSSISPLLNAEQEISRILANRRNYYGVLNLAPQTTSNASVKKSYHKIARVIHPDLSLIHI